MESSTKIMRRSIFTFLKNYNHFTSKAALLVLPFSASILISQLFLLNPSSSSSSSSSSSLYGLSPLIHARLTTLFYAAGFPRSSDFFAAVIRKLSQTISSSILTLPFALTFFLLSKAYVIRFLTAPKSATCPPSLSSAFRLYASLLKTYFCNSLFVLSANSTAFSLLFLAFNALDQAPSFLGSKDRLLIFLSALGAIIYSIVLANALVISNLALVLSGVEGTRRGGYLETLMKACVLIKGRTSTALLLALPLNLGLASVEALFQCRVVRAYYDRKPGSSSTMVFEGVFIAQLYSILLVLDTVVSTMFLKACHESLLVCGDGDDQGEECEDDDEERRREVCCYVKLKASSLDEVV